MKKTDLLIHEISLTIKTSSGDVPLRQYINTRLPVLHQDIQHSNSTGYVYPQQTPSHCSIQREKREKIQELLAPLHQMIPPEKKERIKKNIVSALDAIQFKDSTKHIPEEINISPTQLNIINQIRHSEIISQEDKKWMIYEIITGTIVSGADAIENDTSKFAGYTICAGSYDPWTNGHQSVYERMISLADAKRKDYILSRNMDPNNIEYLIKNKQIPNIYDKMHQIEHDPLVPDTNHIYREMNMWKGRILLSNDKKYLPAILIVQSTSKPESYQILSPIERAYILRSEYNIPYPIILGAGKDKKETTRICGIIQGQSGAVIKGARDENDRKHTATLYKHEKYGQYGATKNTFVDVPSLPELDNVSSGWIKGKLSEYFLKNDWTFDEKSFFESETYKQIESFAPKIVFVHTMKAIEKKIKMYWNIILTTQVSKINKELFSSDKLSSVPEWHDLPAETKVNICEQVNILQGEIQQALTLISINGINGSNFDSIDNQQIKTVASVMINIIEYLKNNISKLINQNNEIHNNNKTIIISKILENLLPNESEVLSLFNNLENSLETALSIFIERLTEDSGSMFDGKEEKKEEKKYKNK